MHGQLFNEIRGLDFCASLRYFPSLCVGAANALTGLCGYVVIRDQWASH